ncbi:unnamed protein product [Echinostoma caproni]|uniref:Growth factor receptor domain-containing protein n=1 Tax=Echinostoma caproni TaxID=27848 RepID=A0A3P8JNK9_9TREM|nr:unnamed protein product [Echinostoma caproni]
MEFLGLTSLRTIAHPTILITGNPNLCFTETIKWDSLIPNRTNPSGLNSDWNASQTAPFPGTVRTGRVGREPYLALRERIEKEIERRVLQNLLGQLPSKVNRPRSYSIPTIFIHGNAHPEFCRGKSASCAPQCVSELGCWGPGPTFCRACRHWSVPRSDGTRLCVDQCERVPGHFTPNQTSTVDAPPTATVPAGPTSNGHNRIVTESTSVQSHASNGAKTSMSGNLQCGICSVNCRLEKNACFGPGSDQCIGSCRWVQDGPYCRERCPLGKFEEPVTQVCRECHPVCSIPLPLVTDSFARSNGAVNDQTALASRVCTGPGNWPGPGGCNYCRQTAILRRTDSHGSEGIHLECVEACPSDTYLHVVNLHYRGGSSTHRVATLNAWKSPPVTAPQHRPPWSHTDGAIFERFPTDVQTELKTWLHNHTQPQLYGVARVCLPCHDQCARNPDVLLGSTARASICFGPGPEQCVRCANASYLGRCVSHCPEDKLVMQKMECLSVNASRNQWRCGFTCPILYKYQVRDHHTGDLVCSTRADRIRVFLDPSPSPDVREHGSEKIPERNQSNTGAMDWSESDDLEVLNAERLDAVHQYNVHFYLSGETAGTLAASAACLAFLLALSGLIYWAVLQQPPHPEPQFVEWLGKNGRPRLRSRMSRACERLWTRGLPRPDYGNVTGDGSGKGLLSTVGQVRLTKEKKYSHTIPEPWSRSETSAERTDYSLQPFGATDTLDALRDRDKPNMATLRIITESQLVRGPLIGSGAFGTVFCGIWRPQHTPAGVMADSGHVLNTVASLSPRTVSTSISLADGEWPDRLEVSWTDSGRVVRVPSHNRGLTPTSDGAMMGHTSTPTTPKLQVEIPVAIKVLTDTADTQTNKELLEEAKARIRAQQKTRANRSVSDEALEFLTNTLSTCPSGQTTESSVTTPGTDSTVETEYIQMQTEWMRTLYVNSRVTTFPKCVQHLIDNNYTYLAQEPTGQSKLSPKVAQTYCSLTINPCELLEKPISRPQTLALRGVVGQTDTASVEVVKPPPTTDPLRGPVTNPETTDPVPPCIPAVCPDWSGETNSVVLHPARRSPVSTNLKPVEEEKVCSIGVAQFNNSRTHNQQKNEQSDGAVNADALASATNSSSGESDPSTYIRLDDYLQPRSQLNQPKCPR